MEADNKPTKILIMNEDLKRVLESLRWKKSSEICADRLNMDLEKYEKLKSQIKKFQQEEQEVESLQIDSEVTRAYTEDLVTGTAEYRLKSSNQPKSIEEVEKLINLDKVNRRVILNREKLVNLAERPTKSPVRRA